MILNASLDTSFWNRACEIGVAAYLFGYFKVHYCDAVRREIVTTDPEETPRLYPQAALFELLRSDGRLLALEPQRSLERFGAGEAHSIALAYEQGWSLLINDFRPLEFAQVLGIKCISVPAFCLLLYDQDRITYAAFRGHLQRLSFTTSRKLIIQAEQIAAKVAVERGEPR